jgi:hypothetical protein
LFSAPHRLAAIAVGVAVLFAVGLTQLFLLRFEAGDVYPAYSSLRTDPLGTRVLFESLNRLTLNSARRNFHPPDQIALTPRTTLLVCGLGANGAFLANEKVRDLMDHVAVSGGRLVLTFSSRLQKRDAEPDSEEEGQDGKCSEAAQPTEDPVAESDEASPDEWLGANSLGFDFMQARQEEMDDTAFSSVAPQEGLPAEIAWRTNLFFDLEDDAWQILYTWQDEPVILQRPWGRGTVVISSDSYLFSNEAMRNHRFADLLAWLVVPGHTVIFDEFHHGLAHQPGIATLARKYRLQGVFTALMVVVVLFIWRQAAVFVPPVSAEVQSPSPAHGRNIGQGLVDLTRRHIPASELLAVCFDTWKLHGTQRNSEALVAQVRDLVRQVSDNPQKNDPVIVYRQICELLKQGKRT